MPAAVATAENSGKNSGRRSRTPPKGKPFEKGKSGNPGGRPKGLASAVRQIPVDQTGVDGAILLSRFWWTLVGDDKADMGDRLRASRLLAERGWGKPAEFVPIESDDPLELSEREADEIAVKFVERLDELAERRRKKPPLAPAATEKKAKAKSSRLVAARSG